jgi:hypothetical protein
MKVEIVHPVDHDGKVYDRGVHELPDDLGKTLLSYPWAARAVPEQPAPQPVAVEKNKAK